MNGWMSKILLVVVYLMRDFNEACVVVINYKCDILLRIIDAAKTWILVFTGCHGREEGSAVASQQKRPAGRRILQFPPTVRS